MGFLENMVNAESGVARGDHCTGSYGPGSVERQRAVSIGAIQSRYSDLRSWEPEDAVLWAIDLAPRKWSRNDRDKGVRGAKVARNNVTDGGRHARGSQASGRGARHRRRPFQRDLALNGRPRERRLGGGSIPAYVYLKSGSVRARDQEA